MSLSHRTVVVSCCLLWIAGCGSTGGREEIITKRLPNGLTVVLNPRPRAQNVAVGVWYAVGSQQEPLDKKGLAHVAEHVFQLGATRGGSPDIAVFGRHVKDAFASTNYDRTRFITVAEPKELAAVLRLEASRMRNPSGTANARNVKRGIQEVLAEIRSTTEQPDAVLRTLVEGHSLARADLDFPVGRPDHVEGLQRDEIVEWLTSHYTTDVAAVLVTGAFEPQPVLPVIEKILETIPARAQAKKGRGGDSRDLTQRPASGPTVLSGPADRVYVIWNLPGARSLNSWELDAVRHLVRQRLEQQLVTKRLSATFVDATFRMYGDFAQVEIAAEPAAADNLEMLAGEVRSEMRRVGEGQISQREVDEVCEEMARNLRAQLDGDRGYLLRLGLLAEGLIYRNDPRYQFQELERMKALPAAAVVAAVRQWLMSEPMTIFVKQQ
jgi:zinc protease